VPPGRHSIDGHDEAIAVANASRSERMRASLSHLLERLFGREDRDERQLVDAEPEPASRPPRHPTQKR
jgi:hypothetical protein